MSTKIYDGAYVKMTNFRELMRFCDNVQEILKNEAQNQYSIVFEKAMTFLAIYIKTGIKIDFGGIDFSEFSGDVAGAKNFIRRGLLETIRKNSEAKTFLEYNGDVDFDFSLSFFPGARKTLLIPITRNSLFTGIFANMNEVFEYGYWDNSDRPDNVTNREWRKRKKDWDSVLPGAGILSECGMIKKIIVSDVIAWNMSQKSIAERLKLIDINEMRKDIFKAVAIESLFREALEKAFPTGDFQLLDTLEVMNNVKSNSTAIKDKVNEIYFDVDQFYGRK